MKLACHNGMQVKFRYLQRKTIIYLTYNFCNFSVDELDSYMYQTVGHHAIHLYADAIGLPLYRHTIEGSSTAIKMDYETTVGDEVEDLYTLLKKIKVIYFIQLTLLGIRF